MVVKEIKKKSIKLSTKTMKNNPARATAKPRKM